MGYPPVFSDYSFGMMAICAGEVDCSRSSRSRRGRHRAAGRQRTSSSGRSTAPGPAAAPVTGRLTSPGPPRSVRRRPGRRGPGSGRDPSRPHREARLPALRPPADAASAVIYGYTTGSAPHGRSSAMRRRHRVPPPGRRPPAPDFRSTARFRRRHPDVLADLFTQSPHLATRLKDMALRAPASPLPIAGVPADAACGQEGRVRRPLEQAAVWATSWRCPSPSPVWAATASRP